MKGAQVKEFALCSLEILGPLMQRHTSLPSWRSWKVMHAIVQLIDQKSMGLKDNLDKAIHAHAILYKAAWPSRLRPKLHFLAHFPLEVLLCGPARHYWCFAFERKNMDVKRAVEASNYKDAWPSSLRPKLHFLAHFPLEVQLCGPARHYWCFAFERKDMDIKRAVEASNHKDASG